MKSGSTYMFPEQNAMSIRAVIVIFCVTDLIFKATNDDTRGRIPCVNEIVYQRKRLRTRPSNLFKSINAIIGGTSSPEMRIVVVSLYLVANHPVPKIMIRESNETGILVSEDSKTEKPKPSIIRLLKAWNPPLGSCSLDQQLSIFKTCLVT
jgi:hypothetical protein